MRFDHAIVIPAEAGTHIGRLPSLWVPASAGMTRRYQDDKALHGGVG